MAIGFAISAMEKRRETWISSDRNPRRRHVSRRPTCEVVEHPQARFVLGGQQGMHTDCVNVRLRRLAAIKGRYGRGNPFRFNHNLAPA
jgi:hypothetical protein